MKLIYLKTVKSIVLFGIQYLSLAFLLLSGPLYPHPCWLIIPYLAGLCLGVWSILAMGIGNLNAGPDVMSGAKLITRGPYRVVRHPMYSAILLVFIPLTAADFTLLRAGVLLTLLVNLLLKIHYEEGMLLARFKTYEDYKTKSWRLLPFVY